MKEQHIEIDPFEIDPRDYSRFEDLPDERKCSDDPYWPDIETEFLEIEDDEERNNYRLHPFWGDTGTGEYMPTEWKSQVKDVVAGNAQYSGDFVSAAAIDNPVTAEDVAYLERYIRDNYTLEQKSEYDELSQLEYIIEHVMYGMGQGLDGESLERVADWSHKVWYISEIKRDGDFPYDVRLYPPYPHDLVMMEEGRADPETSEETLGRLEEAYEYAREKFDIEAFKGRIDDPNKAEVSAHIEAQLREEYAEASPEHLAYLLSHALEGVAGAGQDYETSSRIAEWANKIWHISGQGRHKRILSPLKCIELEKEVQIIADAKARLKDVSDLPDPIKRMHAVDNALSLLEAIKKEYGDPQATLDYIDREYAYAISQKA